MNRWVLRTPEDGTLYVGPVAGGHEWTVDPDRARRYPTYHQGTLARLALERAYAGVGFYSVEVTDLGAVG